MPVGSPSVARLRADPRHRLNSSQYRDLEAIGVFFFSLHFAYTQYKLTQDKLWPLPLEISLYIFYAEYMPKEYDVVVIGSGSAGMVAAAQAVAMGAKTAITEKWKLGGDCPNRACVPTKALLHSAKLLTKMKQAEKFGLRAENVGFDWSKVQEWKDKVVAERTAHESEATLHEQGIDLYWGDASFVSPTEIKVKDKVLKTKKVIIAAGAKPAIFPIPGVEETGYITSKEAVELK